MYCRSARIPILCLLVASCWAVRADGQQPYYPYYQYPYYSPPMRVQPGYGYPGPAYYYSTPWATTAAPTANGQLYRPVPTPRVETGWPRSTATNYPLPSEPPVIEAPKGPIPFHRTPKETFWIKADYTMAFARPMQNETVFATTGNPLDLRPGALGQPGTTTLLGGNINFNNVTGMRVNTGLFLDCANRYSVEFGGFYNLQATRSFAAAGDATGNPLIARPAFNVADGFNREATFITSFPGFFTGTLNIDAKSSLGGGEINGRMHGYRYGRLHTDCLLGFRYVRLAESLRFREQLTPLVDDQLTFRGAAVNAPNALMDEDLFQTSNQFFGAQIGGRLSWEWTHCSLESFAKVGLGVTQQRVNIDGTTTLVTPTGNTVSSGGVFAQASNIGQYSRGVFGIVPEFGVNLGVDLMKYCRLNIGYSLLFWNHVVRPAGQIDRNINFGQAPSAPAFGTTTGPSSPAFRFNDEVFWTHFFSVGIEAHF